MARQWDWVVCTGGLVRLRRSLVLLSASVGLGVCACFETSSTKNGQREHETRRLGTMVAAWGRHRLAGPGWTIRQRIWGRRSFLITSHTYARVPSCVGVNMLAPLCRWAHRFPCIHCAAHLQMLTTPPLRLSTTQGPAAETESCLSAYGDGDKAMGAGNSCCYAGGMLDYTRAAEKL